MNEKDRKTVITDDGSHTLYNKILNEHYHSTFGAIQESKHVFIGAGLEYAGYALKSIELLEIGFGTGLNALLALLWAEQHKIMVNYTGVEAFPISTELVHKLNFAEQLDADPELFAALHAENADINRCSDFFSIRLIHRKIQDTDLPEAKYDVVFFDAFSPEVQPEMWTPEVFHKIADAMIRGGVLTTYSTRGTVKHALKEAGFSIEKLLGPKGKREILRAVKK